ncbi:hypothetical protein [Corynebacterium freiburgense]|uniref:hypothetical protein n=1 Tax=Corynebacterium freiburgense TaxID=556548 RepID=UPI0003F8999B|nr:hypothetical protein [Corynebacterium freiburgense]WJZ03566.1 hypothetical protein CFREI_11535 [Corynebacterium freiburgense]
MFIGVAGIVDQKHLEKNPQYERPAINAMSCTKRGVEKYRRRARHPNGKESLALVLVSPHYHRNYRPQETQKELKTETANE